MYAREFLDTLEQQGFDFFTGVPCSYFTPLLEILKDRDFTAHVPAVREDIAVGVAAGAYLAGKRPVVYMQNSGLGYSLEAFASLPCIYRIPMLVMVSYRGPEDPDWEEHFIMGKYTENLLETFEMPYSIFSGTAGAPDISMIAAHLAATRFPYFLLLTRNSLE
jgi:phosphonopyruvate decarboxylase